MTSDPEDAELIVRSLDGDEDAFVEVVRRHEAAVGAFLAGRIPFGRITELTAAAMDSLGAPAIRSLEDVLRADAAARGFVGERT